MTDCLFCRIVAQEIPSRKVYEDDSTYAFEDLESVHNVLNLLAKREPALVKVLPRQPGTKESRYVHLLSDVAETNAAPGESVSLSSG